MTHFVSTILAKVAGFTKKSLSIARTMADAAVVSRLTQVRKGKVFFTSNAGGGFCCNPKYLALEMHGRKEFDEFVWSVRPGEEASLPDWVRTVTYGSHDALREMASSQVWVSNTRGGNYLHKKKDQYYVQTWHGSLGPKTIEADAIDHLSKRYVLTGRREGQMTDLMFANNDLYQRVFSESFWYTGPVLRCGVPRNKPLVLGKKDSRDKVNAAYGIDPGLKLCLYAPTFRNGGGDGLYSFNYKGVCDALGQSFGGRYAFVVRMHPNLLDQGCVMVGEDVIDASRYPDCQELLAAVDFLITDYSSVYEDFALTHRPACIFAPDYGTYVSSERGLYYPLEDRPAPVTTSEDELIAAILEFDIDGYAASVDRFLASFNYQDDGTGAKLVVDRIISDLKASSAAI